jgi:Kdo2-lipid IVA lauroyltransferase/acyltransferase
MKTLLRWLSRLPLSLLHRIGAFLGWLIYWASPTYAARLRANLHASSVCKDTATYQRVLRQTVSETGKAVMELAKIWFAPETAVLALVQCKSWADVEAARVNGRGLIFLTPHLGCFEIAAFYGGQHLPLTVLYRPPKLKWLEPLMISGRRRGQIALAPANMRGVRRLYKALLRGEAVGVLPDQAPAAGEGAWVPFFGRPAYTITLVTRLQRATNAAIVMAFAERLSGGRGYTLHLEVLPTEHFDEFALNCAIENVIRRCPQQYLWSYNRYKVPRGADSPPSFATEAPRVQR